MSLGTLLVTGLMQSVGQVVVQCRQLMTVTHWFQDGEGAPSVADAFGNQASSALGKGEVVQRGGDQIVATGLLGKRTGRLDDFELLRFDHARNPGGSGPGNSILSRARQTHCLSNESLCSGAVASPVGRQCPVSGDSAQEPLVRIESRCLFP